MNLKKFAVRGLIILAVFVALCMFFSGTIKTITTAKVKFTAGKMGKLEQKTELAGKLAFPETEELRIDPGEGQALTITKVNTRPGYTVAEGDVLIEARVNNFTSAMRQYQDTYDQTLDQLLVLESKNGNIRLRRSDEIYTECYYTLRDAKRATVNTRIDMEALLSAEKLSLPENGMPEGASEELVQAIQAYRGALAAEAEAQTAMNSAERYAVDPATWTYITEKRGYEEKLAEMEQKMQALNVLDGSVRRIVAAHDGYVAEVGVKEGDSYDGNAALFKLTKPDTLPVLRADISELDRVVPEGSVVQIASDRYGSVETKVIGSGIDSEGKKYIDVEVTADVISACGSVYAMTLADTPMVLVNRARESTTLISSAAVHGSGDDRYVYTVDSQMSGFGNTQMTVHKMSVTVLAEADGITSVQEDLTYYRIAYMEDRPINDGDVVMEYIN